MSKIGFESERLNNFFKGEYSEDDSSYVDEIFCDNDKEQELKHLLLRQFYELLPEDGREKMDLNHILYRIHYEINKQLSERKVWTFNNIIKWTLRIAGIMMLPLLIYIGIHIYQGSYLNKDAWVAIEAPAWTRAQFRLPDGTIGWLNSNSSIKYSGNFTTNREVILSGEAFFDVAKDKRRPFRVNTNEISVEVLGTRFNISSYEDEKNVEVVLEEGKLIINSRGINKSYMMNPSELVVYDKKLKGFSTEVIEPQKYLSWKEGKLVFRNDPIEVVAKRLERWYNVDAEVIGNPTKDFRLRATFIDEDLEEVLDLLKMSLPINYRIENGELKPDDIYTKRKVIITINAK